MLTDAFEVHINGVLIYSKIFTHRYPNLAAIVEEAEAVYKGAPPNKVTKRVWANGPFAACCIEPAWCC